MYFGILLVVIGAILLLKNLGFLVAVTWDIIWPVIIILTGLSIAMRRSHWCHGKWMGMCGHEGDCKHCGVSEKESNK